MMMTLFHAGENPVACLVFCAVLPVVLWALLGWLLVRIMRSQDPTKIGPALILALLVPPTVMATANGLSRLIAAVLA
jgi:predicted permease